MLTHNEIKERVDKRYSCKTPRGTGPRPDKVSVEIYGHHASYCTDTHRVWGFVSKAGYDQFVKDFNADNPNR